MLCACRVYCFGMFYTLLGCVCNCVHVSVVVVCDACDLLYVCEMCVVHKQLKKQQTKKMGFCFKPQKKN